MPTIEEIFPEEEEAPPPAAKARAAREAEPNAVTETAAPKQAPTPPPVLRRIPGKKLDMAGRYLPYHGLSVVWPLQGTGGQPPADQSELANPCAWLPCEPLSLDWAELPKSVARIAGSSYVPLPASSYHVTLLDGITASKALGDGADPDTLETNTAWRDYLHARAPRLVGANTLIGFNGWRALDDPQRNAQGPAPYLPPLTLKEVEVQNWGISCVFELVRSVDNDRAKLLDAALVSMLGRTEGRKWNFHLTLAYKHPDAEEEEEEDIMRSGGGGGKARRQAAEQLTNKVRKMLGPDGSLPLDPPRVSTFPDMTRFPPWVREAAREPLSDEEARSPPPLLPAK
jgi:hypothetical protein